MGLQWRWKRGAGAGLPQCRGTQGGAEGNASEGPKGLGNEHFFDNHNELKIKDSVP